MSISIGSYFVALVIMLCSAPTAFATSVGGEFIEDINCKADQSRVILIYMCCLTVCIPLLWFIPETKGKSLEEIGLIFGDRHVNVALAGSESSVKTIPVSDKQA